MFKQYESFDNRVYL